ncbi:hypothetical protein CRYUN_Cryun31cG0078300 [Craigia yunnanensis]
MNLNVFCPSLFWTYVFSLIKFPVPSWPVIAAFVSEIHSGESGLSTSNRCFQITLSPQDDDTDQSTTTPVQLALVFSHTEKYPDEPPLLNVKGIQGIQTSDLKVLKEKLDHEASEDLGMAMIYTLVTSAKEWLSERYGQDADADNAEEEEATKDEV